MAQLSEDPPSKSEAKIEVNPLKYLNQRYILAK